MEGYHWAVLRRYAAMGAIELRDDGTLLTAVSDVPCADMNGVLRTAPTHRRVRDVVEQGVRAMSEVAVPWSWSVGPASRPVHLREVIADAGLVVFDRVRGMSAPLRGVGPPPRGLEVERVTHTRALSDFMSVYGSAFDVSEPAMARFEPLLAAGGFRDAPIRHFVGSVDGTAVSCGSLAPGAGVAVLYGIGTVPAERGRGHGGAMTSWLMCEAARLGHRLAVLWATDAGLPVYVRLGFRTHSVVTLYAPPPASAAASC